MRQSFLVVLLFAIASSGCAMKVGEAFANIKGDGIIKTEDRQIPAAKKLHIQTVCKLELIAGTEPKATITTDSNILPVVVIEKTNDDVLVVRTKDSWNSSHGLTIQLCLPGVDDIQLNSASSVNLGDWQGEKLKITQTGATKLTGSITAKELNLDCSAASTASIKGKVEKGTIKVTAASKVKAFDCTFKELKVVAEAAAEAEVDATLNLNAIASGASKITYANKPDGKLEESATGASTVKLKK